VLPLSDAVASPNSARQSLLATERSAFSVPSALSGAGALSPRGGGAGTVTADEQPGAAA
jgi:hypothetical protein